MCVGVRAQAVAATAAVAVTTADLSSMMLSGVCVVRRVRAEAHAAAAGHCQRRASGGCVGRPSRGPCDAVGLYYRVRPAGLLLRPGGAPHKFVVVCGPAACPLHVCKPADCGGAHPFNFCAFLLLLLFDSALRGRSPRILCSQGRPEAARHLDVQLRARRRWMMTRRRR